MEFKDFAKEYKRMCKAHRGCNGCELDCLALTPCTSSVLEYPDEAEEIISEWSKEHPVKTRQSELLKVLPNVSQSLDGIIDICPNKAEGKFICSSNISCCECKKNYWLGEIEETE